MIAMNPFYKIGGRVNRTDTKNIDKLDNKLIESGLIEPNLHDNYKKVHTFLNSHLRKYDKILTEESYYRILC